MTYQLISAAITIFSEEMINFCYIETGRETNTHRDRQKDILEYFFFIFFICASVWVFIGCFNQNHWNFYDVSELGYSRSL